jgi:hypothetical protein
MNATQTNEVRNQKSTFGNALQSCRQILAQINSAKEVILTEARKTLEAPEQLLRLAVSEAEALALQTRFPQLVFADLAVERIESAAAWSERQRLAA